MANKKRRKNKSSNASSFIIIGVLIVIIVIIALAVVAQQSKTDPEQTASPSAGATSAPTAAPSASIDTTGSAGTVDPATTAPDESLDPTAPTESASPVPTIQQTELSVPSNKIFIIHLTVDSGVSDPMDQPAFDDDLYLIPNDEEPDDYDYSTTKLMILITDHRGNSRIARYDTVNASLKIHRSVASGVLSDQDALAELSIRVDAAENLHLTWAGQTVRITAEDADSAGITASSGDTDITVSARPIGLRNKSDYQQ